MSVVHSLQAEHESLKRSSPLLPRLYNFVSLEKISTFDIFGQFAISSFVIINYLAFKFFISLEAFSEIGSDLKLILGVVFSFFMLLQIAPGSASIIKDGFYDIKRKHFSLVAILLLSEILLTLALLLEITQDYALYALNLSYEKYIVCYFLISLIRFIQTRFEYSLNKLFSHFFAPLPKAAKVFSQPENKNIGLLKSENDIPVAALKKGDIIKLEKGDVVPVSCMIAKGFGNIEEIRPLKLLYKSEGDYLKKGSLVFDGVIEAEVVDTEGLFDFTAYHPTIVSLLNHERQKTNYYLLYNFSILFISVCSFFFWRDKGLLISDCILTAVSVLLSSVLIFSFIAIERQKIFRYLLSFLNGIIPTSGKNLNKLRDIENFAIEYDINNPLGEYQLRDILLVDDRMDKTALYSILFNVFGLFESEFQIPGMKYLKSNTSKISAQRIDNYEVFNGEGIEGFIEGSKFCLGTEQFLIDRGVNFHLGDLSKSNERVRCLFFSISEHVLARIDFNPKFSWEAKSIFDFFRKRRTKLSLVGTENSNKSQLDSIGKLIKLDLAQIYSKKEFNFSEKPHTLIFARNSQSSNLLHVAPAGEESVQESDYIFLGRGTSQLKSFFAYIYKSFFREKIIWSFGLSISIFAIILSATRMIGIVESAEIFLIVELSILIFAWFEFRQVRKVSF